MVNKKSAAQKRIRTSARNYHQNRAYKTSVKTAIKNCISSTNKMSIQKYDNVLLNLAKAFSKIDKSVKRKIIHRNKAARQKAYLFKIVKNKYIEGTF
uniref:Ribosomal protein S20 n=1 Tax=Apophlaea sinclairii TaxID=212746 RepID=A0A1C9CBH0_9FLOR|nr:ribosomal protein S20 [Apophlaea sinclairii]AOM65726.1 ribosomal protein S20 [Apophlaea sinclairii]